MYVKEESFSKKVSDYYVRGQYQADRVMINVNTVLLVSFFCLFSDLLKVLYFSRIFQCFTTKSFLIVFSWKKTLKKGGNEKLKKASTQLRIFCKTRLEVYKKILKTVFDLFPFLTWVHFIFFSPARFSTFEFKLNLLRLLITQQQ